MKELIKMHFKKILTNYNLNSMIVDNETFVIDEDHNFYKKMCLKWKEDYKNIRTKESRTTHLQFERNEQIADSFIALMREHDGVLLSGDIDDETNRHTGIGIDAGCIKKLYVLDKNHSVLGWIEATCVDCPWRGGFGPSFMELKRACEKYGLEVLPPGEVSNQELLNAIPRCKYSWEMIDII